MRVISEIKITPCKTCSAEMQEAQRQAIVAGLASLGIKETPMPKHGRPRSMSDGSIVFPRKGAEPPPDIDGFVRDPGDAWRFKKLWMSCPYRIQNQFLKSCGSVGILSICNNQTLPTAGQEVKYSTCLGCPVVAQPS